MKKAVKAALGIAAAAGTLYFSYVSLKSLDFEKIWRMRVDWAYVAAASAVYAASLAVYSMTLSRVLARDMKLSDALRIVSLGNAANLVLPLKAGEGVRYSAFPGQYDGRRRSRLMALMLCGGAAALAAFVAVALIAVPFRNPDLRRTLLRAAAAITASAVAAASFLRALPATRKKTEAFINESLPGVIFFNLASMCCVYVSNVLTLIALGFGFAISLGFGLLAIATTNLSLLIPASPGGIGLFELAVVVAGSQMGVDRESAVGAGMLMHLVQYAGTFPLGAYFYIRRLKGRQKSECRGLAR